MPHSKGRLTANFQVFCYNSCSVYIYGGESWNCLPSARSHFTVLGLKKKLKLTWVNANCHHDDLSLDLMYCRQT